MPEMEGEAGKPGEWRRLWLGTGGGGQVFGQNQWLLTAEQPAVLPELVSIQRLSPAYRRF